MRLRLTLELWPMAWKLRRKPSSSSSGSKRIKVLHTRFGEARCRVQHQRARPLSVYRCRLCHRGLTLGLSSTMLPKRCRACLCCLCDSGGLFVYPALQLYTQHCRDTRIGTVGTVQARNQGRGRVRRTLSAACENSWSKPVPGSDVAGA